MWLKELKFMLCYNLKQNFYKMMYPWYTLPEKMSSIYKALQICCVGNVNKKGHFSMLGGHTKLKSSRFKYIHRFRRF